jgi:phage FluMu gp28-like protein
MIIVAELLELRPSKGVALKPSEVIAKFAARMKAHGCSYGVGDAYYRESVTEHLLAHDLAYVEAPQHPADYFVRARQLMREGVVRLPDHTKLLQQLREVRAIPTSGGRMSIQQPRTAGGHGDLASALCLAVYQIASAGVTPQVPPELGTEEWNAQQREKRQKRMMERANRPFWRKAG